MCHEYYREFQLQEVSSPRTVCDTSRVDHLHHAGCVLFCVLLRIYSIIPGLPHGWVSLHLNDTWSFELSTDLIHDKILPMLIIRFQPLRLGKRIELPHHYPDLLQCLETVL